MSISYPVMGQPNGYQQVTNSGTAGGLTVPSGTTGALIAFSGNGVRIRTDGTAPTASVGFPFSAGDTVPFVGNLALLSVIAQTGTATLDVLYFK